MTTLAEIQEISRRKGATAARKQFVKRANSEQWANRFSQVCKNLLAAMPMSSSGNTAVAIKEMESLVALYDRRQK